MVADELALACTTPMNWLLHVLHAERLQPIQGFHVVVATSSHRNTLHRVGFTRARRETPLLRRQACGTHRSFRPFDHVENASDGQSSQHSGLSRRAGDTDILRRRNSYAHAVFPRTGSRAPRLIDEPTWRSRFRFWSSQIRTRRTSLPAENSETLTCGTASLGPLP